MTWRVLRRVLYLLKSVCWSLVAEQTFPERGFMTSVEPPQPTPSYSYMRAHPQHWWPPAVPTAPSQDTVLGAWRGVAWRGVAWRWPTWVCTWAWAYA